MAVRIRLARFGRIHRPFYRVVVTDSKTTRDGKNIEVLGFYNPLSDKDDEKVTALKFERIKYWLSVGAQPTEPVERFLTRAGVLPLAPVVAKGNNGGLDALTGDTLNQEQPANVSQNENDGLSPEAIFSIGLKVD